MEGRRRTLVKDGTQHIGEKSTGRQISDLRDLR
jgi:hypothetical protein